MILSFGGYSHQQDEVRVTIDKQKVYSENGITVEHELHRWTIEGEVLGSTPGEIVANFQALEQAYGTDGADLILRFNDGATVAHRLLNSDTYSGTRIISPPSYPIGDGTELHNARTYRIVIEAEVKPTDPGSNILLFQESLTFEGGGPELAVVPLLVGPPDIQTLYQQTEVLAVQEGTITGRNFYPALPSPLFPGFEWRRRRRVRYNSPRLTGLRPPRYTDWRVEYSYTFLSASGLAGFPHAQTS
jgi:hypothetical protein